MQAAAERRRGTDPKADGVLLHAKMQANPLGNG